MRNEIAGATYHVFARGVDRRRIFVDEDDYAQYVRLLAAVVHRQRWHLLCFCLMPNHVHLLVEVPETNLGNGMQWLHSRYALAFNERYARAGHLFESPYKSPIVDGELHLARTAAYIVMNPVAAALTKRAADWQWSSHAIVQHGRPLPTWLGHDRLEERFTEFAGPRLYPRLIAARERAYRPSSQPVESALSTLVRLVA